MRYYAGSSLDDTLLSKPDMLLIDLVLAFGTVLSDTSVTSPLGNGETFGSAPSRSERNVTS